MSRCPPSETLAMYASGSTTSTSAFSSMSAAVTSPGPSLAIVSSMGSSRSSLNFKPLTLRMMSTTSSLTPSIVENSCETPSIRILVTAAPVSPESMTRLSELPRVWPSPRGNGSATKVPRRPSSSSTLKRGGAMSNIVKVSPARNVSLLPAVELDDQLLFDGRVDLFAPRRVQDPAREVVVVGLQPGRNGDHVLDGVLDGHQVPALLLDRDDVAGLEYGRRNVVLAAVELEVPVHDELARLRPAGGEAHPVDDVVHPQLHEPEEVLAGDALHPGGPVVGPPELLLGDPVVPAGLLLLHEPEAELGLAAPAPSVLSRRVGLLLQRVLPHGGEHYPGPPVSPAPRSCVTCHTCYPLRLLGGLHPLCGWPVTSFMESTSMPMDWKVRAAMSLPEPWPLTSISTRLTPWSMALFATLSAVIWAANGVLLRLPLKPRDPADSQAITLPSWSLTETMVLLKELFMWTTPVVTFLRTRRRALLAVRPRCRCCLCLPIYLFFLPPIEGFGPLRWRAFFFVRCPRTGRPLRCLIPRYVPMSMSRLMFCCVSRLRSPSTSQFWSM